MRTSSILVLCVACLSPAPFVGCSSEPAAPVETPDAGSDADAAPEIPCGLAGISKGPWVLAVDGASAKIRWEACKAGTKPGITFTPEAGGAGKEAPSVEAPFEVTETFEAPLNPEAQPDQAGTYYMHEVALTGLEQGTCYRYELAAEPERAGRFCTARPAGEPIKFMAIGDTNPALGDRTSKILSHLLPMGPDFVIHGGDIQYYDSTIETWALWFPKMQPMFSQGAFFPAVGNHENERPGEYEQYYLRFFAGAGQGGTNEYYRFQSGGVWFFSIDSEQPRDLGSVQGTWLASQIEAASKEPGYRFSVVFFHKPLVTCGDTGDSPSVREQFEPIFTEHKVALVVQAHMHGYERFEINGITYVTTAGGGGALGDVDENIERPECAMREASGAFRHAMMFEVGAGELKGTAIDEEGATRDTFTKVVP